MSQNISLKKMPKAQRYGVYFLSFLTIFIIALWIWQFNYRLTSSFKGEQSETNNQIVNENIFSDFENPEYLSDSIDLASGADDNLALYNPEEVPDSSIDLSLIYNDPLIGLDGQEDLMEQLLSGQADPVYLREILVLSGLEQEMVDQLSDEEITEIYQEILADSSLNNNSANNDYEESLNQALSGQSDPDSIRELLKTAGLEQDIIDQLSDEEIMAVYQEALQSTEF
jgi:hypothetical protein